jgi:hypothetical protein
MRAAANEYRAKAFEYLSLAECMNDPERRAETLRYAHWWTQLAEPVGTFRSAYGTFRSAYEGAPAADARD